MAADDQIVRFFSQHLVPILFNCEKELESRSFIITAFVLSVSDHWFLITAGHCIRDVELLVSDFGYEIKSCSLIDSAGPDAKHREPIPFAYEHARPQFFTNDSDFDYGVIPLSDYYRDALERNGIAPLDEEVWNKQPLDIDFYKLLGIPAQLTEISEETFGLVTALVDVEVLPSRPESLAETDFPMFYGRIALGQSLNDIEGMSGGPILGFREGDLGLKYWLVAIQSGWLPVSRIIVACPVRVLGEYLETVEW